MYKIIDEKGATYTLYAYENEAKFESMIVENAEAIFGKDGIYFDIKNDCWWDEMLDFIGAKREWLPKLCDSAVKIGEYKGAAVVTSAIDQIDFWG